ncbi:putative E3 ubiquitin-protein ligase LIN-2 [Dioscorea cayenensis subsp. rotundata]|uniref:RING-type E3 ubiquitin transferase n=1 Tax=Dioscorea cayennensis subsp. rotundata TaxID=55577 RepID=A0AB40BA57_DIOCR|nr:putative E3 ubiquitin-protein ligase LIN-2 [Dioscorea cayenensis subsp. rotundata]
MPTVTPAVILRRTSAFLEEVLSQPDLRRSALTASRLRLSSPNPTTLQALALLSQHLDSAAGPRHSASLRTAEKLLLTLPSKNPLSSTLLALVHAVRRRPREAGLALLDLFEIDPLPARYEIAAAVFEDLFIPHLLPAIQWFADQRSRLLGSQSPSDLDLKELEKRYESILDENTRAYAKYLKEVIELEDSGWEDLPAPLVVLKKVGSGDGVLEDDAEEGNDDGEDDERQRFDSTSGRCDPMWSEDNQLNEFLSRQSTRVETKNLKTSSANSRRTVPSLIGRQESTDNLNSCVKLISGFSSEFSSEDSNEYDSGKPEKKNMRISAFPSIEKQYQDLEQTSSETTCYQMFDSDSILPTGKSTPPKDFVCPITSNIFDDPVTLETGQTYERKAIQEWLERGNSTCPITRQNLQSNQLPKTNYVLRRLIASWREQNNAYSTPSRSEHPSPKEDASDASLLRNTASPTRVISQANIDGTTSDLRSLISSLCTSEVLAESEVAVLQIEQLWREAGPEPEVLPVLSKPAVVNGFVEILFNSPNNNVLRSTVFMLSELASRDQLVVQTLTRVDSDVDCMISLFKKGLMEAVVLIYLLSPTPESLIEMDMVDALMMVIKRREYETILMCLKPRTASLFILNQMLRVENQKDVSELVSALISERVVEGVVLSLEAELIDERLAAAEILLTCMKEDGSCRNIIADTAEFEPLLESFSTANDDQRFLIAHYLAELVKLSRRTFNEQLLHIIKDGGPYSTMHILLVHLQTALQDQSPIVASLLLQLDILVEPRKMSIYREEAVNAFISCLKSRDFPNVQLLAAETILALQGRFSPSGKSLARAYLLKRAGMNKSYRAIMRAEQMGHVLGNSDENLQEEKAADEWERRVAFALVSHEFGLLFEALAEGMKTKQPELFSACLVCATWLIHMLSLLPDMGIQGVARTSLLKSFVSILKSSRDVDDKALAMLALRSFMNDPDGLHDLTSYIKYILKALRELKKSSALAYEMLKLLSDGQETSADIWNHKELAQAFCSSNGEVLSIICIKNRIISGHSDGTMKVWNGAEGVLQLIQEAHEHSKAVTSLVVSGDKIYSGSMDKTMRVWSIRKGEIQCLEIHDVKDQVQSMVVSNTISCFIPQGAGVKVISLNGGSKVLNQNKQVKSLALVQGKLYCGCHDNTIQEIDLATGTTGTIQAGNRKLLGKSNPIYTMQIHDGLLYTTNSPLEGAAVKIWDTSNYNLIGSLPSTMEVRSMFISTEFIYLGCKMGIVEVWSREKLTKISTLQCGTNSKILCMAVDADGELLVVGTSDGRIQAWGLT